MFAFVAVVAAQSPDGAAETLRAESVVNPDSYQSSFETSNGIFSKSEGHLETVDKEMVIVQKGEDSYTSPEGEKITVTYVADQNGTFRHLWFHPISISSTNHSEQKF